MTDDVDIDNSHMQCREYRFIMEQLIQVFKYRIKYSKSDWTIH